MTLLYNLDGYSEGTFLNTVSPWVGSTTVAVIGADGLLDNNGGGSVRHPVATNNMEIGWVGGTNVTHTGISLAVRCTDHYNNIRVRWKNATTLMLAKMISTVETEVATYATGARAAGESLRIRILANGDTTVFYNGNSVMTWNFTELSTVKNVGITSLSGRGSNFATSITVSETFQDITSVANGTDNVYAGGTFNCAVVDFGATVTGGTLDGVALSAANNTSLTVPGLVDGVTTPKIGSRTLTLTDGSLIASRQVNVGVPAGLAAVQLASNFSNGIDTILYQFSPAAVVGDWIYYDPTEGTADKYGYYTSDSVGVMTLWHVQLSTGIARSFNVVTDVTTVRYGVAASLTTTIYPTATGIVIDGRTISTFSGSANNYNYTLPTLVAGAIVPRCGYRTLTITDGTTPTNYNVDVLPSITQTYVTLTSVGVGLGHVGNYLTCAIGDQIVFDTATTLGVGANGVNANGAIQTDYSGTQTMWHIRASDGLVTELTVITPVSIGITSVNSGVVYVNGSSNTVTTVGLPTANGASLGSYPISGLSGSNNSYSFTLPTIANGVISPLLGNRIFTITDGTSSPTLNINVLPSPTLDFITLSGNGGTTLGYVGNTITCVAGDQIIFSKPATLSITENGVRADGSIFTDYNGTQTMYHRRGSDGLITEFSVLTSVVSVDKTPNSGVITPVTNAVLSQSYTSTGITVSGMDAGVDVACTITGGTYEISSNGGSSWSVGTSAAGVIRNGYLFRLTGTASNLNNTVRNVVFSVGEGTITNFTYVITTVAAPRTINLANKLVRNLVSPLYDTKVTTSKTETVPNFIPGNNTTLLHSSVTNNTTVWLLNVPNFTTATIKLKQNITKAKGNIQVQINNTTGLSVGNNKLYLCKLNSSNAILTFKRVNINIT